MPEPAITPPYRIVTPRLVVRCWRPADAPLLVEALKASAAHLSSWMPWAREEPQPLDKKVELLRQFRGKFDLGQDFIYAILDPAESRVIGGTGLHPRVESGALEIGYWVHVADQGKGYITESTAALVRVAFEVCKLRRVEVRNAPQNVRSGAVPGRLGFVLEGTKRRCIGTDATGWHDAQIWTMFAEEYPSSPAAKQPVEAYDAAERRVL